MGGPVSGGSGGTASAGPGHPSSSSPGGMAPAQGGTPSTIPGNVTTTVANADTNKAVDGKGAVGGVNSKKQLTPGSRGVFGLQGIGLTASAAHSPQAEVITSTGKNVHLDSGTQLLLVTQAESPAPAPKS